MTSASENLLTEIERQNKYLEKLPQDYSFPLFNSALAVESMRQSAYRDSDVKLVAKLGTR